MKQKDLREHIQREFLKRKDKNPSYSLRAFAKYLAISAGALSEYLNGTRNFSHQKSLKLALRLGMNKEDILATESTHKITFDYVDIDRFHLLSKWYHIAILESLQLDGFQSDPKWIAKRLQLSLPVVKIAIEQLFKYKILQLKNNGEWTSNWTFYSTQTNELVDESALREHQTQLLDLAKQSIHTHTADKKSHTAYISALDSDLIPEIQQEIAKFRKKIAVLIEEKSKKRNEIYCLQINFFPEMEAK